MKNGNHSTLTACVRHELERLPHWLYQLACSLNWRAFVVFVGLLFTPIIVKAQGTPSTFDNANSPQLSADQFTVVDIQKALLWTGYYNGQIDGQQGPGMRAAVVAWQKSQGRLSVDTLTAPQLRELIGQAAKARAEWQWTVYTDPSGRLQIGYPAKLFTPTAPDSQALMSFGSTDGGFRLQVFLPRPSTRERFEQFYLSNTQQQPAPTVVDYKARAEDWFVVSGTQEQFAFYRKTQFLAPSEVVSFTLVVPNKDRERLGFLTAAVANSFRIVSAPAATMPSAQSSANSPTARTFSDIKPEAERREPDAATKKKQEIAALEEDKRLNPTKLPSCNDAQVLRLLTGLLSEKTKEKVELVDAQPRPPGDPGLMSDVYVPADGLYRQDGMEWRKCASYSPYEYMGAPRRHTIWYRITWQARAKGEFIVILE